LRQGLCRPCRADAAELVRDVYFTQFVRLTAGKTYRQWQMSRDAPHEMLLRRAFLDGDLEEVIEMVFREAFEQGVLGYPVLIQQLQHDLEIDEEVDEE